MNKKYYNFFIFIGEINDIVYNYYKSEDFYIDTFDVYKSYGGGTNKRIGPLCYTTTIKHIIEILEIMYDYNFDVNSPTRITLYNQKFNSSVCVYNTNVNLISLLENFYILISFMETFTLVSLQSTTESNIRIHIEHNDNYCYIRDRQ